MPLLGGTLYICWQDLGRPNLDSIYYARFKPATGSQIKFLDFGYRLALIARMVFENQETCSTKAPLADFAVAQAVCWPLLAACSIKKMHAGAPFIHEYIIPQLLLQWILNQNEFNGIRYFSVNQDAHLRNPAMACNYVFPACTLAPTGHCTKLKSLFQMSEPQSWRIIERMASMERHAPYHGGSLIPLINDSNKLFNAAYRDTPFGLVESRTLPLACATI